MKTIFLLIFYFAPAFGANEHLYLAPYIKVEIPASRIDLSDIDRHPDLWAAELVKYYNDCSKQKMDPDGLCIPGSGDERRAEILQRLARALPADPESLLPAVKNVFQRDPAPEARRVAYQIFAKMPEATRDRWAEETYDIVTDERTGNRMEESLLFRAAVAVNSSFHGLPARRWPVKTSILIDVPNIELALRSEGVDADLSALFAIHPITLSPDACVSAVLDAWVTGSAPVRRGVSFRN